MQQLRVFPNDQATFADAVMIDLYEQDPIKLTLSVEDITNAEASSVFSKTFRVPATSNNNQFFKHAFLIDGIDYDVTIKKPAEVLVDGAQFRRGHIRLQKIFVNGQQDKIEYEILFLGETRDFSTKIGDKAMCELFIPELLHALNNDNVIQSWQAFPVGNIDDGLFNGDVLYPLIDHGNTYENGVAQEPRISMEGANRFTQNSHPIGAGRFKPMIRAKRLLDKIFEDAEYTYESTFLESDLFLRLYVSAFGNDAQVTLNVETSSTNNFQVTRESEDSNDVYPIKWTTEVSDPGSNFNIYGNSYTVPISGNYTFAVDVFGISQREISSPGGVEYTYTDANIALYVNGTEVFAGGSLITPATLTINTTIALNAGDVVTIYYDSQADQEFIGAGSWSCTSSPGLFNPTNSLDCEYKQIDFIKDILTLFRLVMSPDPFIPNKFIIEPYVDYIYTGETYDWSDKLVRDKDLEIEPLFNTQSDRIEFRFSEDGDYINNYHQDAYQQPYGYLAFDSGNELLKGTRKIDVKFAPTPTARIEGSPATSSWIIPQLHTHESGDNGVEHLPIKGKTRLLFYNGLLPTDEGWYMANESSSFDTYPCVSPYETFPQQSAGLNLNWFNDVKYWGPAVSGYQQDGITLFQRFWQPYINDLYNKFARRVTGTFILNNVDLQDFTFNDIVFVDGVYYRPEKVIDAPIGQRAPVKVQLIKAINYRPSEFEQPMVFAAQSVNVTCNGLDNGAVAIEVLNGLPPYQYEISNGDTGFFATYTTTLGGNFAPGTYTITITEAAGFSAIQQFTITEPTELTANETVVAESPAGAINGEISVTPSGGTAPYTILWDNDSTSFTRTGLSTGNYSYTITDDNDCTYSNTVFVPVVETPLQVSSISVNPTDCSSNDGSIDLTITGGVAPYNVDWADIPGTSNPTDRTGLDAGTYTYTVTDNALPPNQVGPINVVLTCVSTVYSHNVSTTLGSAGEACNAPLIETYWSQDANLVSGSILYLTQSGAENSNPSDYVPNGYYSALVNGIKSSFQVINGAIQLISICIATCYEYVIGGYDQGCTTYIDCNGFTQTACYNGPAASGYDQTDFCATSIVSYTGSQPVNQGPCPY